MPRRCAFSLIELTIVLLIMGVMAGVAAPRYSKSLSHFRVESAAKRLIADLRYAQGVAQQTATSAQVKFDPDNNSYELVGIAKLDRTAGAYVVSFAEQGYPVDLTPLGFGFANTLTFDQRGGTTGRGQIRLESGGWTRTIRLEPPRLIQTEPAEYVAP